MVEVKARQERACPFACSGDVVPTTREVLCLSYRKVHLVRLGRLGDGFFCVVLLYVRELLYSVLESMARF